jgi:molybdopterin-guanine dinucleotide biosynthesis protein B
VEGFKHDPIPKIEIYRAVVGEPLLHPHDTNIVAIASDAPLNTRLPQLDLNQPPQIADFMLKHLGIAK